MNFDPSNVLKEIVSTLWGDKDASIYERLFGLAVVLTLVGGIFVLLVLPDAHRLIGLALLIGYAIVALVLSITFLREHEDVREMSIIVKRRGKTEGVKDVVVEWFVQDVLRGSETTDVNGRAQWTLPSDIERITRVKIELSKQGGGYRRTRYANVRPSPPHKSQTLFIDQGSADDAQETVISRPAPDPLRRRLLILSAALLLAMIVVGAGLSLINRTLDVESEPVPTATPVVTPEPDGLVRLVGSGDGISPIVIVGLVGTGILLVIGVVVFRSQRKPPVVLPPKKQKPWGDR